MINQMIQMNTDPASDNDSAFFYNLFQHSMIGQAVVDKNLDILFANNQMLQCFQLTARDLATISFGDAFNCAELLPDCRKCGETEQCENCGIWRGVQRTLSGDAPLQNVIQYSFQSGPDSITKWFQLNSRKITWRNEQYAALVFVDISEMKQKERHLRIKLTLDLATGTLNKTSLMRALRQLMESEKINGNFTVCMIDFDHFKAINDQYGHLMGDRVLKVFSNIARSHIRSNDMIGRYGGEEFIFIFYETDQREALQILKRIHSELAEYFSGEIKIPVTFSAGAVYVEAVNSLAKYTDLLGDVDKMLYHAKTHGRGRAMSSIGETLFTDLYV